MDKNPKMLQGLEPVSIQTALNKAVDVSGIQQLKLETEEEGRMPSYLFKSENATVSITKAGGLYSYMLNYRDIANTPVSAAEAVKNAKLYLNKIGMNDVTDTYYEIQSGVCIINFAGAVKVGNDDVTLYTDLIKVGVALDNGEVLSYDARGYLTNHYDRSLSAPKLTPEQAQEKVSQSLSVQSHKLCVIPSNGLQELYCYEFKCVSQDGQQVLVYVNADTGTEEKILLLQITGNGTLTI
jgi:germination protein YpeB